jgi:hypothetical protein
MGPARPYLAAGATAFISGVVGLRAALGASAPVGPLRLFADAALEQFVLAPQGFETTALLVGAGAGWNF